MVLNIASSAANAIFISNVLVALIPYFTSLGILYQKKKLKYSSNLEKRHHKHTISLGLFYSQCAWQLIQNWARPKCSTQDSITILYTDIINLLSILFWGKLLLKQCLSYHNCDCLSKYSQILWMINNHVFQLIKVFPLKGTYLFLVLSVHLMLWILWHHYL